MSDFISIVCAIATELDREALKGLDMNEVIEFKIDEYFEGELIRYLYPDIVSYMEFYADIRFLNSVYILTEACRDYTFYTHRNNFYLKPCL